MIDKKLLALIGRNKKYIAHISINSILMMLLNVSITATLCYIMYEIVSGMKVQYYITIPILLVLIIARIVLYVFDAKLHDLLGAKVKKDLREKTYNKLLRLGISSKEIKGSNILQVGLEGIEQLDLYYGTYLPNFFFGMITPIILLVIAFVFEWRAAIVLLICIPLIPVSIIAVSKYAKKVFNKYWDKYTSMGDSFLDNLQGMSDLKIFNADEKKQIEAKIKAEEFRKITMKVLVMQLASVTIMDIVAYGGAAAAIITTLLNIGHHSNEYVVFSVLFLVLISAEFFLPIRALGSAFHIAMNGGTAGKRILEFLNINEIEWGDKSIDKISSFDMYNLEFSYDERFKIKIKELHFRKGFNAIVGESGSGKSTLVSLILRGYDINKGLILLNNANDLKECKRDEYYKHVGLISNNTYLFNMSIRDNFYLSMANASDSEIYAALDKVRMKDDVLSWGGLDYIIKEGSENISGGQRQRLALAINLISDRDVYIFDEATSNIDIESEEIIIKNIQELSKERIVIFISHRMGNVVESDNIHVFVSGQIVESGTHEKLIKNNSVYANIYRKQNAMENAYKEGKNA